MSDLVGNPEDRFSRVAAHLTLNYFHLPYFNGLAVKFSREHGGLVYSKGCHRENMPV